ncbi:MAG: YdcF family protein [Porphyrobacter sp.]|nr:YdcF family protein [Porphyrobacter sp.]
MIRRILSSLFVLWALGFLWFAAALPQPAGKQKTDAIVVPTGSGGRIPRGLTMLRAGEAPKMLVTGVFSDVKPREFEAEYGVSSDLMDCCVTLGFAALDTRGNARETAEWIAEQKVRSLRLVTSDWHMRRAALELQGALPDGVEIVRDAVPSKPSLSMLFLEYHKFLAAWAVQALPG